MASRIEMEFKSPVHKLLSFFRKSRDGWKRKCIGTKRELKLTRNRIRDLKTSRELWRQKAKMLQEQLAELGTHTTPKNNLKKSRLFQRS